MNRADPTGAVAALLTSCQWEPGRSWFTLQRPGSDGPDLLIADLGSIFLFYPRSHEAQEWWRGNVERDATIFRRNFVVEHRFVPGILDGLARGGFVAPNGGGDNA